MILIYTSINIDWYTKIGYRNHPLYLNIQKETGKLKNSDTNIHTIHY